MNKFGFGIKFRCQTKKLFRRKQVDISKKEGE